MIFTRPLPFEEAIESRRAKAMLPTALSSRALDALAPELREQAFFSARTNSLQHLSRIDGILGKMIDPTGKRGDSWDASRARMAIRESLQQIGYNPADINAVPGSLKDLGSERRINLILDTNVKMARGYGNWAQGQDPAVLDEWPGSELVRHEGRVNERPDWPRRFVAAGGRLYGGRMIALKDSPVWTRLSRFGLPYPPFDYNSGMGLDDVDRDECIALGLIDRDRQIEPQTRPFHDNPPISGPAEILDAAARQLGPRYGIEGGALVKRAWQALTAPQRTEAGNLAVRQVIATQGDVIDALWREDTGSIDLRWGDDKKGIAHILKRRDEDRQLHGTGFTGMEMVNMLPEIIVHGTAAESAGKITVKHDGYTAILARKWDQREVARWVLTAFDPRPGKGRER
jgi:hypothetical protein